MKLQRGVDKLDMNILQVISNKIPGLAESQQTLGAYILEHYREVANLSALDLGKKAGVSDATVVRFAKAIGFSGYAELKKELYNCVAATETPSEKMIKSVGRKEKIDSALTQIFQTDIHNIQRTFADFSKDSMNRAIEALSNARKLYILGLNSCESLAVFLHFHLRRLHLDVELITSGGLVLFEQLAYIDSNDGLVVISYPRYSKDSLRAISLAKDRKACVISITDKPYSPIAKGADISLIAHSSSPGFYNSYAAATTICNALVFSIAMQNESKSLEALRMVEKVKDGLYI
ncbi:MAG: MurR/RpiR family transcriptional regulator [bacterium]